MASSAGGGLANSAAAGREEEAILKAKQRLATALAIKEACRNGSRLSQMLLLLRDLVDGLILDVAIEAHREAAMGTHRSRPLAGPEGPLETLAPEDDAWEAAYIPRGSNKAGSGGNNSNGNNGNGNVGSELASGSGGDGDGGQDSDEEDSPKGKHGLDLFGQRHPPVPTDTVTCLHCSRKVTSGRFAPHLEKCMGKGRNSRAASRLLSASSPDTSGPHRGAGGATAGASSSKRQPPQHGKGLAVSSARSARTGAGGGWGQAHRMSLQDHLGDDSASNGSAAPAAHADSGGGVGQHYKKPKHDGSVHGLVSATPAAEPPVKHAEVSGADDGPPMPLSPFEVIAGSSDEEPVGKRLLSGAKASKPPAKKPPAGKPAPSSSKPPPVSSSANTKKKKTKMKPLGSDGSHGAGDKRGGPDPMACDTADPLLFDAAGGGAMLWDDAFLGEMPGLDDPLAGLSLPGLDALAGMSTEDLPPGLAMAFPSNPGGGGGGTGHKPGKGSLKGGSAYLAAK